MTIPAEDVRWKLTVCETCGRRKMMPIGSASCLSCETARRATVLPAEDVRWIIAFRGPDSFIRAAWMLATADASAATGLDLRTGAVTVHRWGAGEDMPETDDVIVLAVCPASRRAELPELLAVGSEGSLPAEDAEELAAEVVVRAALGDGGERFWNSVDGQLRERARR